MKKSTCKRLFSGVLALVLVSGTCFFASPITAKADGGTPDSGTEFHPSFSTASPTATPKKGTSKPHTHNYRWVVTIEPTAELNGLCEDRCECGDVKASQPISYLTYIVKKILSDIKNAPENGTVTISYKNLMCLSSIMIEALQARPDVTVNVQFTDKSGKHQFTIPAGKAPTDGADYYGFYYLERLYS